MRIVLDTNVLVSGIFFSGPPFQILKAWREGKISFLISNSIFDEYQRVARELSVQFPEIDMDPILALILTQSELIQAAALEEGVCSDPDDDMFLACALAGKCKTIVSGDKELLKVTGYKYIEVLRPAAFITRIKE